MTCYTTFNSGRRSGNPLIVSSLLQNKCDRQQFTAKYQKEERFLFFFVQPFLPPFSSALRFPLTKWPYNEQSPAFHLGGKMHPRHSSLSFRPTPPPPLPSLTPLSTCISSQRGGSQGGNYSVIQKWRGKKNPFFFTDHQQHWESSTEWSSCLGCQDLEVNFLSSAGDDRGWFFFRGGNGDGQLSNQQRYTHTTCQKLFTVF